MNLFPVLIDLNKAPVLVVGGGEVARRKITALRRAGAWVRVGAPELAPILAEWVAAGVIDHLPGRFCERWLDDAVFVIAATDDDAVNRQVAAAARARRLWVNVVDDAGQSSAQLPAVVERGDLKIAISSGGAAPMLATRLRGWLERELDPSLADLVALLGRKRARIRRRLPRLPARRRFFDRLLDGPVPDLLRRGQPDQAERALERALTEREPEAATGSVALVGAGPGDAGLLTLRGLRLLQQADVILHDRLVGAGVLELARRDAERIEVGKQGGGRSVTQEHIHALMLAHAGAGRRVVRLKGGDPFVFGRGGEELEFLRRHRIAYEVVPGVTAALACAAYAGIPLTHRDHAQSLRLLTAHCKDSLDRLDWPALADDHQTLAVYMALGQLQGFRDRLLSLGRSAQTPFAVIENGSTPQQRVVVGRLYELPELARRFALASPALVVIGSVAALAQELHWYGAAPLSNTSPASVPSLPVAA